MIAQSELKTPLKNIKVVSVGGLARAVLGCAGPAGGVEGLSSKLPYEATIYCMTPFEPISTPQLDSRQCGHVLCQENHPSIADSLSVISH